MDDFPERRGPMSKMCGLLTFGWQVELENEAIVGDNSWQKWEGAVEGVSS